MRQSCKAADIVQYPSITPSALSPAIQNRKQNYFWLLLANPAGFWQFEKIFWKGLWGQWSLGPWLPVIGGFITLAKLIYRSIHWLMTGQWSLVIILPGQYELLPAGTTRQAWDMSFSLKIATKILNQQFSSYILCYYLTEFDTQQIIIIIVNDNFPPGTTWQTWKTQNLKNNF